LWVKDKDFQFENTKKTQCLITHNFKRLPVQENEFSIAGSFGWFRKASRT